MSVVETTTFRLAPGVRAEDFLSIDRRVQTELAYQQPGLARRTTARRGDAWMVVTLWATEADAAAFEAMAASDPLHAEFVALVEAGSLERRRYDTLD